MKAIVLADTMDGPIYGVEVNGEVKVKIKREADFTDFWVARYTSGQLIDWDKYRHDLFQRMEIELDT